MNKKNMPQALVVDDQVSICETLAGILSDEGWLSVQAYSGLKALELFKKHKFQVVFLDVWMSGLDGIETLQAMQDLNKQVPIYIMSGHGNIETAVKATKLGAKDFLEKPLSLEKILSILDLVSKSSEVHISANKQYDLIGSSEFITSLRRQINTISSRNSWVFITGENGTGKEIVARNIHLNSKRSDKPFVAVNCAAIPEDLIESELFGFKKGAFTNALNNKKGKFEIAHQGTLFLDEIGDMSLKTQAKILRILQEQSFERLGDNDTISVDVRVVAATNKNLQAEIESGHFREDLYYRLNVIPLHMQPLRERRSDIASLVDYFLGQLSLEFKEPKKFIDAHALKCLSAYHWPGNIRELKNLVERLCILIHDETIKQVHVEEFLPHEKSKENVIDIKIDKNIHTLREAKNNFEKYFLLQKLEENDWNITKTAEMIHIERSNLHRKLKSFDIDLKRLKI